MTALDVITLAQAKEFLVIDFPDRDAEITRHIKSAIGIVERYTNHMMYQRDKTYSMISCSLEIYDYPINLSGISKPVHYNVLSATVRGKEGDSFTVPVGYASGEVPEQLVDASYKIITYLAENKDVYEANLPADVQCMINQLRRSCTI